jgi:hypothetical protein
MGDTMPRPSKASLQELPELDVTKAKIVRRGPRADRTLTLTLREMREAASKSQADVGAALGSDQAEVSRLERREDMMLSTLRKFAAALGAHCEVAFVFPAGQRIVVAAPTER